MFVATARTLFQSTPRSTRSSLNVDRQVFVGRPRGVHDMAWLAGRPGGILMIRPAIRSRLSATMSCNLRCPVRLSTSMLVTWSFQHVMPRIFLGAHMNKKCMKSVFSRFPRNLLQRTYRVAAPNRRNFEEYTLLCRTYSRRHAINVCGLVHDRQIDSWQFSFCI